MCTCHNGEFCSNFVVVPYILSKEWIGIMGEITEALFFAIMLQADDERSFEIKILQMGRQRISARKTPLESSMQLSAAK